MEITDNEFQRQFESHINDTKVKIEYSVQERKIFLTKFIMPEELQEEHAETFMAAVFDHVSDKRVSLVPTSPQIARFMKKNRRKYRDLLPVGISI